MRIEIVDLPANRKVKHLKVDIVFEEDGSVTSTTSVKEAISNTVEEKITPPTIPEQREKKDVPPEMLDLEF